MSLWQLPSIPCSARNAVDTEGIGTPYLGYEFRSLLSMTIKNVGEDVPHRFEPYTLEVLSAVYDEQKRWEDVPHRFEVLHSGVFSAVYDEQKRREDVPHRVEPYYWTQCA
jgi:hypothetical protein